MLLRGGPWEMEVLPARGGRITSLRLDGEELLEQGIGIDDPEASGFVAGGGFGGGEMVSPVPAPGAFAGPRGAWRGGRGGGGGGARAGGGAGWVDRAGWGWGGGAGVGVGWDVSGRPYVGVGVCNGGLGGCRQVGVEPATGGYDRPDSSAAAPLLWPGEELRWWLEVRD